MKPLPHPLTEPPKAVKQVRLDTIVLVPASLLSLKGTYQPIANRLPKGSILCVQSASPRHKSILEKVASFFRKHGHTVFTLPLERITSQKPTSVPPKPENLPLAF